MNETEIKPGRLVKSKALQDIKKINLAGVKNLSSLLRNRCPQKSGNIMDFFYASGTTVCVVRHQDSEQEAIYSAAELQLLSPLTNQ